MAAGSSRSTSYEVLSNEQKHILANYYDKGMTSTGSSMRAIIAEVANKADTSFDKVKVRLI